MAKELLTKEEFLVNNLYLQFCISKVKPVFEGRCEWCGMETVQYSSLDKIYSVCLSQSAITSLKGMIYEEEKRIYSQENKV